MEQKKPRNGTLQLTSCHKVLMLKGKAMGTMINRVCHVEPYRRPPRDSANGSPPFSPPPQRIEDKTSLRSILSYADALATRPVVESPRQRCAIGGYSSRGSWLLWVTRDHRKAWKRGLWEISRLDRLPLEVGVAVRGIRRTERMDARSEKFGNPFRRAGEAA